MPGRASIIICAIASLTILVTIILIACSLSVLSYTEVGLNYSDWFKTIEDRNEPYEHGIHFIGLGHSFKRYKINLETIEFSKALEATLPMIKCRTKDGLELDLEASLQYKVDKFKIFKIYTQYGNQEKAILTRVILDVISDVSTLYNSDEFFEKRPEIQAKMKDALVTRVREATHHLVDFFQLRSIALPAAFETEIRNTEVKKQDILKAQSEQQREQIKFATKIAVAKEAVNTTIEAAYAATNKTINEANAVKSTIQEVVEKQSTALKAMKETLGFDNKNVLQYLQTTLIKDYKTDSRLGIHIDDL